MKIPQKFTVTVTRSELFLTALALFFAILAFGFWWQLGHETRHSVLAKPILVPMPFTPTNNIP